MVVTGALALPLAGCGEDKPQIPSADARGLITVLETVRRQTEAHACTTVEVSIASLERRTEALPSNTDEDIRSTLNDGIANLRELVASECAQEKPKPEKDTTDTTTPEPETTTPPDTSGGVDTSGGQDQNEEPPPDETPPPDDGSGEPPPDNGGGTPPAEPPSGGAGVPPGQKKKGKHK